MQQGPEIKFDCIQQESLQRGDIILFEGDLWQCVSLQLSSFINLDTRINKTITSQKLCRVEKLELIPRQWSTVESTVQLKGQELGLGPMHEIEVLGMKQFQELELVKGQMQKGKRLDYKVVLIRTKVERVYLLASVELL